MLTSRAIAPRGVVAAAVGLVSAAVAIGVAELVAAASASFRSPVLDVGDRVIDAAPPWLKDFGISVFGSNDKAALLIGIAVLLALFAMAVGIVTFRIRPSVGVAAISLFGVIGGLAAVQSGRGAASVVPSIIGTLAAVATLLILYRVASAPPAAAGDTARLGADRRALLIGLGSAAGVAVVGGLGGRLLSRRFAVPMAQRIGGLPVVDTPAALLPSGADLGIPNLTPFVTSNSDFYRVDTALTVPQIATDDYELSITGMVDRPFTLSYEDLLDRDQIESDITLACVSNEVGGRLVGNARWQGVRLDELLADARVDSDANQVVGRSIEGFTVGFPLAAATDGRDAMVAIGMNGVRLPLEHGFPARLIVPGLYGYVSATKWLTEIELTTFDSFDAYWQERGWAREGPIKTQSRIDTPRRWTNQPVGPSVIAGVAWAPGRGIDKVEVQIGDDPWREATLSEAVADTTWRQFHLPWDVTIGTHTIRCRATDGTGVTQTEERTLPRPDGASGWHHITVTGVEA